MTELLTTTEKEFVEFAKTLGEPIASRIDSPIIDNLIPLQREKAHKSSLSSNFGTDNFPFHTDGAYFVVPPRYIVLRYVEGVPTPTPTLLCDLSTLNLDQRTRLKFDVWKVHSRTRSFYSSILSENGQILRYDKCIMSPTNKHTSSFIDDLILAHPKIQVEWKPNKTIVIDNWASLHARPKVTDEEINIRKLQRIMIL
jgi:alpha-ketoglutarate-dependent taurine dioxygenase